MGWLDHMVILVLNFWGTPNSFPWYYTNLQSNHQFTMVLFSPHPCQYLSSLVLLMSGVTSYQIAILILIFLMISDAEHLFMYLLDIYMSSWKNVYSVPQSIFNHIFGELYEFFICFRNYPLYDIRFANIFSHPICCLFNLLIISFAVQKILNLI